MLKSKFSIFIIILAIFYPFTSFALTMPFDGSDLAQMSGVTAEAYIVQDVNSGQVLIEKNANEQWTPASLTKLVTSLVVLDAQTKLTKVVSMTSADQIAGACSSGGACIRSAPGVKFTVDGLFHAALMPSANNAANALARSTGLSTAAFVQKMNQKVASLGATGTHFNEPTGMDPNNKITAADYAKIVNAAFSNSYLRQIAGLQNYTLRSANNSRYNQTIKNTDQLLADPDLQIIGAKTGYLTESQYNFASLVKNNAGQELAVVVLGEQHLYTAFAETKELASLAQEAQLLAMFSNPNPAGEVLGASTTVASLNNSN